MTDAKPKRKLVLMPEVLPDPTPHYDAGAPRHRTLAHLERLRAKKIAARAERQDDGTLEVRVTGSTFPESPPPFGYGLAFVRVESTGTELVLRLRALPEVPVISLVVAAVPRRVSLKIDMSDLDVTAHEVEL